MLFRLSAHLTKYRHRYLLLYGVIYLFTHLALLPLHPLPWWDETFFAAISHDHWQNGTYYVAPAIHYFGRQQAVTYGPVFFFLTDCAFSLFGFSLESYRAVVLLGGLACVTAFMPVVKRLQAQWQLPAAIAVSADPFLMLSMHEGRMDLLATACVLWALVAVLYGGNTNRFFVLAGILIALALLTTPRIAFWLPAFAVLALLQVRKAYLTDKLRQWLTKWSLLGVTILGLYTAWVVYAFGGFTHFFAHYAALVPQYTHVRGFNYYIPKHQYMLLGSCLLSTVAAVWVNRCVCLSALHVFAFTAIGTFFLVVYDQGPYSAMVVPAYYLLLFNNLQNVWFCQKAEEC